jgi:hypothetical protein
MALLAAGPGGEEMPSWLTAFYHYSAAWHLMLAQVPRWWSAVWRWWSTRLQTLAAKLLGSGRPGWLRAAPCHLKTLGPYRAGLVQGGLWRWTDPGFPFSFQLHSFSI